MCCALSLDYTVIPFELNMKPARQLKDWKDTSNDCLKMTLLTSSHFGVEATFEDDVACDNSLPISTPLVSSPCP